MYGNHNESRPRACVWDQRLIFPRNLAIAEMAMKIKDGLFLGDAETSQSEDFINDNKISNLINLAGRELPNLWSAHGLVYMTFNWEDRPDFRLGLNSYKSGNAVRGGGDFVSDMVEFIDISIMHGISVLLFSKNGTGRAAVAVCIYLMVKYRWGFEKAFEYLYSKKPDVNLNRGFVQQLYAFDKHLLSLRAKPEHLRALNAKHDVQETSNFLNQIASLILTKSDYMRWKDWNPSYLLSADGINEFEESSYDRDELILVYSYINSKVTISSLPGPYRAFIDAPPKNTRIRFVDSLVADSGQRKQRTQNPIRGILKGWSSKPAIENSFHEMVLDDESSRFQADMKESKVNTGIIERHISRTSAKYADDDLYGYVGVESGSMSDRHQEIRHASAEERLKKLVAGLNYSNKSSGVNGQASKQLGSAKSLSAAIYEPKSSSSAKHSDSVEDLDYRDSENKFNKKRIESQSTSYNAFQAYKTMQRTGVVKAAHEQSGELEFESIHSRSKPPKNSWVENPMPRKGDSDIASVDSMSATSAASGADREPPRQYRCVLLMFTLH